MSEYKILNWLSDTEIKQIETYDYWNDEEKEKNKEWYILDCNFQKMQQYIESQGYIKQIKLAVSFCERILGIKIKGTGADLAAGTLWAIPYILDNWVKKIYCIEISKHRLLKIGPKVLDCYNIPHEKVILCMGSFYEIKLADNSLDFVFLITSFHHAYKPNKLLKEIKRILKPKGVVIIIGEKPITNRKIIRSYIIHFCKFIITKLTPKHLQKSIIARKLPKADKIYRGKINFLPDWEELFPPNNILGDHYYSDKQYREFFSNNSFESFRLKNKFKNVGYVLINTKDN